MKKTILWNSVGWAHIKKRTGALVTCGGSPVVHKTEDEAESVSRYVGEEVVKVRHTIERLVRRERRK